MKDEALKLAKTWFEHNTYGDEADEVYKAIEQALAAPVQEPVKLRRGDILRCIETDELCTVWATSTTGKTLVKWSANNFGDYTAEQIGELFWIEPAPVQEPVAYDKTELNCFAQNLYDQKMREGKRGHYESMFHVIHQCIKKVAPPPAAQPAVPDAFGTREGEHPQYIQGWNDCRAEMLRGMK